MIKSITITLLLTATLIFSGCQTISGAFDKEPEKKTKLKGKRISVLKHRSQLVADDSQYQSLIVTPTTRHNKDWPQQNTSPVNHLMIGDKIENNQTISIGEGTKDGLHLTSTPIIANNTLFTIDGDGLITARKTNNLENVIWSFKIGQDDAELSFFGVDIGFGKESNEFLGGNITFGDGLIYVTTRRAKAFALNAKTGKTVWARTVKLPIEAPTRYHNGKIYLITSSNTLFALDSKTGKTIWKHSGLQEITSLYGAPSPVVGEDKYGEVVIVPYSSGEIYALDAKNGKAIWGHMLNGSSTKFSSLLTLSDIDATPVIANEIVYAVSHEGSLSAIELRTGRTIWSQDISSIRTPWVGGDFLYILTTNNEIACLDATDGTIKWVQQLRHNEKDSKISILGKKFTTHEGGKILWNGPILAQDNLILVGSHGKAAFINPYRGVVAKAFDIPENSYLPAIVADKAIYFLSNDGELAKLW